MSISEKQAYRTILKDYPDILNMKQLCAVLSVSKKTAYKFIKDKDVQYIKVGREYRIPKVSLLSCLLGSTTGTNSGAADTSEI